MSFKFKQMKIAIIATLFVLVNISMIAISCSDNSDNDVDADGDVENSENTDAESEIESTTFNVVFLADTHIIDEFYKGPEGSPRDTESIFKSKERLENARDHILSLDMKFEAGFVAGDVFHNYPSTEMDFFNNNVTRIDNVKTLMDSFEFPMYLGMGNHDYDIPDVSHAMTHQLISDKFGFEPYYYIDIQGFRFISLNNFLGETMKTNSAEYHKENGSFGNDQLEWLAKLLEDKMPTIIFLHFPLGMVKMDEGGKYKLGDLLKQYKDSIKMVFAGHMHTWLDFGEKLGPPHMGLSSTRYDKDAYLLLEFNKKTGNFKILNEKCIYILGSETDRFTKEGTCEASPE